jgi:thiamine pyrophosphokinase
MSSQAEISKRVVIVTTAARQEDPAYIGDLARAGDILIAADAGLEVILSLGLTPDLAVGDFDSVDEAILRQIGPATRIVPFPPRKNKTDTHLALEQALATDPDEVIICGAFGDRLDHVLGLVTLLAGLETRATVRLLGARQEIRLARKPAPTAGFSAPETGLVRITGRPGDTVSLLPLSPIVTGVETEGLDYPLSGATLRWGETLGVSNEMLGQEASVRVDEGLLLVAHLKGKW